MFVKLKVIWLVAVELVWSSVKNSINIILWLLVVDIMFLPFIQQCTRKALGCPFSMPCVIAYLSFLVAYSKFHLFFHVHVPKQEK